MCVDKKPNKSSCFWDLWESLRRNITGPRYFHLNFGEYFKTTRFYTALWLADADQDWIVRAKIQFGRVPQTLSWIGPDLLCHPLLVMRHPLSSVTRHPSSVILRLLSSVICYSSSVIRHSLSLVILCYSSSSVICHPSSSSLTIRHPTSFVICHPLSFLQPNNMLYHHLILQSVCSHWVNLDI